MKGSVSVSFPALTFWHVEMKKFPENFPEICWLGRETISRKLLVCAGKFLPRVTSRSSTQRHPQQPGGADGRGRSFGPCASDSCDEIGTVTQNSRQMGGLQSGLSSAEVAEGSNLTDRIRLLPSATSLSRSHSVVRVLPVLMLYWTWKIVDAADGVCYRVESSGDDVRETTSQCARPLRATTSAGARALPRFSA